jgi:hypothetical protein
LRGIRTPKPCVVIWPLFACWLTPAYRCCADIV